MIYNIHIYKHTLRKKQHNWVWEDVTEICIEAVESLSNWNAQRLFSSIRHFPKKVKLLFLFLYVFIFIACVKKKTPKHIGSYHKASPTLY